MAAGTAYGPAAVCLFNLYRPPDPYKIHGKGRRFRVEKPAEQVLAAQLAAIHQELSQTGLHTVINLKQDMANEWHLLKQQAAVNLVIAKNRLHYMVQRIISTRNY